MYVGNAPVFFYFLFMLFVSFGVLGKPAFFDSFFLFKKLFDAPQAAAAGYCTYGCRHIVLQQQGKGQHADACNGKEGPYFFGKPVFALDHQRMIKADDEKG